MFHRRLLIAALGAAALVSGCGSSDEKTLLTNKDARALLRQLESTERSVNAQNCRQARSRAREGLQRAEGLPNRVDPVIRRNLRNGFEHLIDRIGVDCEEEEPETTATPSPSPSPTATVEETPEATPTPTPSPSPTPTATPEETAVPPDTGGQQSPEEDLGDG